TFFIRLFVPESERWQQEQKRGTTSSWAARDLVGVGIGAVGAGAIIYLWTVEHPLPLIAADFDLTVRIAGSLVSFLIILLGYTYPVVRYLQRTGANSAAPDESWRSTIGRMLLGACVGGVALLGTWASIQWAPLWADQLTG